MDNALYKHKSIPARRCGFPPAREWRRAEGLDSRLRGNDGPRAGM